MTTTTTNAETIAAWLISSVATKLARPPAQIDRDRAFADLGLSSFAVVALAAELSTWLGRPVAATVAFDHPTIRDLGRALASDVATAAAATATGGEAIAIVGVGVRAPAAAGGVHEEGVEALWSLLVGGADAVALPPPERGLGASPGGYLARIDTFDAELFGISPREASAMDPQQRVALEVAWEALEDAAISPDRLRGTRTGVFFGASHFDYARLSLARPPDDAERTFRATGVSLAVIANRISYALDLRGPSWTVDSACSSSLVAIHQAVRSLRSGESQLALAGGVNLIATDTLSETFSRAGMLSRSGRCRTFDAGADGYVRGEGCGVVVLKRLADAIRDGDRVRAVVAGSAVAQDGHTNGLTAPSPAAQQAVIEEALADAQVRADEPSYIEAHGTGTPLGDPIEVAAIARAIRGEAWVGSIKTNIGHLEAAAGVLGLIKLVLALERESIPPNLHLRTPSAALTAYGPRLRVPTALVPWRRVAGTRRVAGVSAFGFGGTLAHVVVTEAPSASPQAKPTDAAHVLLLSARTEAALRALASRLAASLGDDLAATAATLALGRAHLGRRAVVIARDVAEAKRKLCSISDGAPGDRPADGPGAHYLAGHPLDPAAFAASLRGAVTLPCYPFERRGYWLGVDHALASGPDKDVGARDVEGRVASIVQRVLELPSMTERAREPLVELGADSLAIVDVLRQIRGELGVEVRLSEVFDTLTTVEALARHVAAAMPVAPSVASAAPSTPPVVADGRIERLFAQQLEAARGAGADALARVVEQQLAFLREQRAAQAEPPPQTSTGELPEPARAHLGALVERHGLRTARSKSHAAAHRGVLADPRQSAGFRPSIKELVYPIVGARAHGPRLWDIDGNAYVDLAMGFGVHLFGHEPPFITSALRARLEQGVFLGPQSADAGPVAELVHQLTGAERVTFAASGTDAITIALRLAHSATGRAKIVVFEGAYHGHVNAAWAARAGARVVPGAPGFTSTMVADTLVLPYGAPSSLDAISASASELAAVLVEPVPSRRPGLQPVAFLRELSALCRARGVVLIFDEVITGFRAHARGAQGALGVEADLSVYGKVVGGGLPIGLVAGPARLLDAIDGGAWRFGDDSRPRATQTVARGTFYKHPLAMAAARATLTELARRGPQLQLDLDATAARLESRLERVFGAWGAPIRIERFGSMFRFETQTNLDAFYPLLAENGVYTWEGRTCFLSTAHGEAELDHIVDAVDRSVGSLADAGYWTTPSRPRLRTRPLTTAERQLVTLDAFGDTAARAHIDHVHLQLTGPLSMEAIRASISALVDRHEALRTTFPGEGGMARVVASAAIEVPLADLSGCSGEEIDAHLALAASEGFELGSAPLLRARVLKLGPERHRLCMSAHHLVVDGWSWSVLRRELAALYSAAIEGRPAELPPPVPASSAQRAARPADEAYWLEAFGGEPLELSLPFDRPRPKFRSYAGDRVLSRIDATRGLELKAFARANGATLSAALLSVFSALLHRLSGQAELIVATSTASRDFVGADRVVGYLTHLLPLKSQLTAATTAAGHLTRTQSALATARDHASYPFATLLDKLDRRRDPRLAPLVSAVLNLDRGDDPQTLGDLSATWVSAPIDASIFELGVNVTPLPDGALALEWDYARDVFDRATIERFAARFEVLLAEVLSRPETPVTSLAILPTAERELIERYASGPSTELDETPVCLAFSEQAARTPDAVALVRGAEVVSFRELDERSDALASELVTLGVGPDTFVGACVRRTVDMAVTILGIMKAGGAYLPLDPALPPARLAWMIEDSGARCVVADRASFVALPARIEHVVYVDRPRAPAGPMSARAHADHLAYMTYTSGSTGRPKGVPMPHRGLSALCGALVDAYALEPGARVFQFTSLSWDIVLEELFTSWRGGGAAVLPTDDAPPSIDELVTLVETHRVTWLDLPASYWHAWVDELIAGRARVPNSLATVVAGSERVLWDKYVAWHGAVGDRVRFRNAYGQTETAITAIVYEPQRDRGGSGSVPIGRPIANTRAYVMSDLGAPEPIGVAGELYIEGPGLARGYHGLPDLTAKKFVTLSGGTRAYRTGDRARLHGDGTFELLGRTDEQLKVRGVSVEPAEIEAALTSLPGVREAYVCLVAGEPTSESSSASPAASAGKLMVRRSSPQLDVSVELADGFVAAPRENQRNWIVQRAVDELTDEIQHLDRLARSFVPGSERVDIGSQWQTSAATYDADQLIIEGQQVMQAWEEPMMRRMAEIVTESHGDVLEVGFGMGISADYIQRLGVRSHTIVECNHDVLRALQRWRARHPASVIEVLPTKWQDARLGQYDGIFFDTYPLSDQEYVEQIIESVTFAGYFFETAARHLRPGGVFTYYTNEIDSFSRRHQRLLGRWFDTITLEVVRGLSPPADSHYWWSDSMVVVKATKPQGGSS